MIRKLSAAVLYLSFSGICTAEGPNVLRDHLGTPVLEGDAFQIGYVNQFVPNSSSDDTRTITGFLGDGNRLVSYEAYYYAMSDAGPLPSGFWDQADFRFSFWGTQSGMLLDPRGNNQGQSSVFDTPSNIGWDVPVFTLGGVNVYRFRWDLEALDISTSLGNLNYISVTPVGLPAQVGLTFLVPSTEGAGSIGSVNGYFWPQAGAEPPITAAQFGGFNSFADRITTVPTPGGLALVGACALVKTRRRRS